MLSYNDIKDEIQLKQYDNRLFGKNIWYAFYKEIIPLTPGYLNKESLINDLNKENFEEKFKESITKWIDNVFMTRFDQSTEVLVLEGLYKDKKIIKILDDEINNRLTFNIAFSHNNDELINILINDNDIKEKKYEVHTSFSNISAFTFGLADEQIKENARKYNIIYSILEGLYDNKECFAHINGTKKNNFYKEAISYQLEELNANINVGNKELSNISKNNFSKIMKKLNIKPENNTHNILKIGMKTECYDSLMSLYNELNLKKKTLFVERIKEITEINKTKTQIDFCAELTQLYNIEKQYYDLTKMSQKKHDLTIKTSIKTKKI